MKQILNKILSSLLAIIVLFSTFSFTVDSHYCGGRLVEFAIFSKANSCTDNMDSKTEDSNQIEFSKIPCCKNVTSIIEGQDIDLKIDKKITQNQIYFVTAYIYSLYDFSKLSTHIPYDNYLSPLIKVNKNILFENFRI